MRRDSLSQLTPLLMLLLVACNGSTAGGSDSCDVTSDCAAGEVCVTGDCLVICASDLQCDAGSICVDSTCEVGVRDNLPSIDTVDGDSNEICPDAQGTHCLAAGIVVGGAHLDGAAFALVANSDGQRYPLGVRDGATDALVSLDLPDVTPGSYVLTATNSAGSADQALTLLQGPTGPPGADADLTGAEIVTRINGDSTAADISSSRLPVGTGATDVAAGQHGHHIDDLTSDARDASEFVLMHPSVGIGITDPSGLLEVGEGYTYSYVDNVAGTPSPACECDQDNTSYDCGTAEFVSNWDQGSNCYDTGTGGNDHYQRTNGPALSLTQDNLTISGHLTYQGIHQRRFSFSGQSSGGSAYDEVLLDASTAPYGGIRGFLRYLCHNRGNSASTNFGTAYFSAAANGTTGVVNTAISGDTGTAAAPRWVGTDLTVTVPQYNSCDFIMESTR